MSTYLSRILISFRPPGRLKKLCSIERYCVETSSSTMIANCFLSWPELNWPYQILGQFVHSQNIQSRELSIPRNPLRSLSRRILSVSSFVGRRKYICGGVGSQNYVWSPQNPHCAGLPTYGGRDTPIPRMDLDPPCVPVGWRVALFGRLGHRGRCFRSW